MKNRKIKRTTLGIIFSLLCLLVSDIGIQKVCAEGEVTIVREGRDGLEQLEAIYISEETLSEWELAESTQNASGTVKSEIADFLTYGSDYGYRDMEKRSNSAARQEAYRQMEKICMNFSTNKQNAEVRTVSGSSFATAGTVSLKGYSVTKNDLIETYYMFRNDNPQYFWLSNQVLYGTDFILVLTYDAYKAGNARDAALAEIVETARTVYQSQIYASDDRYTKILKLHDTLIADIEYSEDVMIPTAHSIAGAMTSARSAVCEGYAKVMQVMMNHYGIDNIYVTGDAGGGHAWNMVRMDDGNYYWLDATWDDQYYEEFRHDYFLVGNDHFTDHEADLSTGTGTQFLYDLPQAPGEDYVYDPQRPVVAKGDIDQDGSIKMRDLMMCLHHVSGRMMLTGNAFLAADIDSDGTVKMIDLMRILHYVSGRNTIL